MYDLNDAEPQRGDLIPDCYAKVTGVLRPGGIDGQAPGDRGLLRASRSSDVLMLDWEFTIVEGRYRNRKFWQTMTVSGGDVDEKGVSKGWNITKSLLRAMIDSALGLNPKDESEAARTRRQINAFADLNGIGFIARIGTRVDKHGQYKDSNVIDRVITPDRKEYQLVVQGQEVPVTQKPAPASTWGPPGGQQQARPATASQPAGAQQGPAWMPPGGAARPVQSAPSWQQPAQAAQAAQQQPAPANVPAAQAQAQPAQQQPSPNPIGGKPLTGPAWLNE